MRGFAKFSIIIRFTHEDETASMTENNNNPETTDKRTFLTNSRLTTSNPILNQRNDVIIENGC
jgi:hypothetical protein